MHSRLFKDESWPKLNIAAWLHDNKKLLKRRFVVKVNIVLVIPVIVILSHGIVV